MLTVLNIFCVWPGGHVDRREIPSLAFIRVMVRLYNFLEKMLLEKV